MIGHAPAPGDSAGHFRVDFRSSGNASGRSNVAQPIEMQTLPENLDERINEPRD